MFFTSSDLWNFLFHIIAYLFMQDFNDLARWKGADED